MTTTREDGMILEPGKRPQTKECFDAFDLTNQFKKKPDNKLGVELYGLYKHGTSLSSISDEPRPAAKLFSFDFEVAKKQAMWDGWQEVVNEGITPGQAQQRYVEKVEAHAKLHGVDPDAETSRQRMGREGKLKY
ncbi:MAG: hypothetical protein M1817_006299 [Caeruleum heppii]|nr:MAG: hypothetical protein M1817_006299 [Caeruleum heppii]